MSHDGQVNQVSPARLVLIAGLGVLAAGVAGTGLAQDPGWIRFFDNLHWTAGTLASAWLAWLGVRAASAPSAPCLRWMAVGLTAYAVGQLVWNTQASVGYAGFPSPSDLFYLWLGPCVAAGLLCESFRLTDRVQRRTLLLDSAILAIAVTTVVLVLYLPLRGDLDLLSLAVIVAYPVSLLSAASIGLIAAPTLHLKFSWSYGLFLASLMVTGGCWMAWNAMALEGAQLDGLWFNGLFSLSILGMGAALLFWRVDKSDDPRWERLGEGLLRQLPLAAVVLAGLAMLWSHPHDGVPTPVSHVVDIGAIVTVLLAVFRQSLLLREHDQLLAVSRDLALVNFALNHVKEAAYLADESGRFHYVNDEACKVMGYAREELLGLRVIDVDHDTTRPEQWRAAWEQTRAHKTVTFESRHRTRDGKSFPVEINANYFEFDGRPYVLGLVRDITERKQIEQQIRDLAYYDVLTRLPNRRMLMDRLAHALAASERSGDFGALMILDLDHFKSLNDTQGHDVGDQLLVEVARRLTSHVRQEDSVCRLGGDEFVVMLEGLGPDEQHAAAQVELIAEKVRIALNQPFQLSTGGGRFHSTTSIGLTLFRGQAASTDLLLKQADVALYQAKDAGRNLVRFFNPAMQAAIESRMAMEAALRQALERQEFRLYYQPQVDCQGNMIGAEALLRWMPAGRPLVLPNEFIPLAEETGLIQPIGKWVLATACAQLKAWEADPRTRHLYMSVNVSARQFHQPDFVDAVRRCIEINAINPARLKLELTESVVLENLDAVIGRMQQLAALGVSFCLDDFGTGYSSLSYLKRLPLDQVKIDQSFVRDVPGDPNDTAIVRAILAMSRSLGLQVVAEGVETKAQRDFLLENDCTAYQGFLFCEPLPIEAWGPLLK